ncbi:hypothetical protein P7K49_009064 [Saguinus oedipus]|uniref:Uncharacterized protein n=1 Tax=Saguinus oedipus TaxID=9490 RepID=A0ABQ9VZH3_SAGOE|nr:hypothetical protein P7K49_009064 [Saguinus oedipus]
MPVAWAVHFTSGPTTRDPPMVQAVHFTGGPTTRDLPIAQTVHLTGGPTTRDLPVAQAADYHRRTHCTWHACGTGCSLSQDYRKQAEAQQDLKMCPLGPESPTLEATPHPVLHMS